MSLSRLPYVLALLAAIALAIYRSPERSKPEPAVVQNDERGAASPESPTGHLSPVSEPAAERASGEANANDVVEQDPARSDEVLVNDMATIQRLVEEGASSEDIQMLLRPAKLSRYGEMIAHYRASGDASRLWTVTHVALCNLVATDYEIRGQGSEAPADPRDRPPLTEGHSVVALNGREYVVESWEYPLLSEFSDRFPRGAPEGLLAADTFYVELGRAMDAAGVAALAHMGGRTVVYERPWTPD